MRFCVVGTGLGLIYGAGFFYKHDHLCHRGEVVLGAKLFMLVFNGSNERRLIID